MSSFFGQILLPFSELKDLYQNHLYTVIKSAHECRFIMNILYEQEFETDIVLFFLFYK